MRNFNVFKQIYTTLPIEYQKILSNFITSLEHDFKRLDTDADLHKNIEKLCKKKNISLVKLSDDCDIDISTMRKSKYRRSNHLKNSNCIAEYFNISEYELLYGEPEYVHQSKIITNMQKTFLNQSPSLQLGLIALARDLYLLSIDYSEDEYSYLENE